MNKDIFIPKSLIKNANDNKLVFFIGAGFSRDFGFPDWHGLVKLILEKIIDDDKSYSPFLDLLESKKLGVLEILEHIKNEKRIIRDTIYNEFKFDTEKTILLEKHKKLLSISTKIITTNYDQLLERAGEGIIEKIIYTNNHLMGQISNRDSFILKIHGDHEDAENCVLLKEDYENLYKHNNAALAQFKNIITNNTVLFLGFSLSDPYVSNLFRYIKELYKGYNEKSYIITINNEDFSQYNVKNINLNTYDEIVPFLDKLHETLTTESKKIKPVEFEIDEDELKSFILDFNKNKKRASIVPDLNEEEIENKYENMVCSESFRKEIEGYSSYFPSIDEIMMSPSYMDFDKKTIITSTIMSSYNRVHNNYENGESIFEATVDEIYKEYSNEIKYSKALLKFYIKILVAWTIIGCDIFNEDKRKKVNS
ncbi:SIR2 family protein [Bacillus sp. FJAT-49711]|uniref:SIR2 family protein n=1 Tax=Bacillus sp. FJAT-49711 TaxID=2833585 RepID=UPI001BC90D19|nr:SIR2 family protein [Bacillus sp. FJAT-49711]MBS4217488.1 SIR2 family protein [Bacillus sp. FJAT-49711]